MVVEANRSALVLHGLRGRTQALGQQAGRRWTVPPTQCVTRAATMSGYAHTYPTVDVVPPRAGKSHDATVIMLHGLGDTSQGWLSIGHMLAPALPTVKWIFPTAPTRPITCNGGMQMPGWYDIMALGDIGQRQDEPGIEDAARYIDGLVQKEVDAGIPESRIVVGGFSQGGAIALMMLRKPRRLAALLALSTYLPLHTAERTVTPEAREITRVFQGHGTDDALISRQLGHMARTHLEDQGLTVSKHEYPMGHSACDQEFKDLAAFLQDVLRS